MRTGTTQTITAFLIAGTIWSGSLLAIAVPPPPKVRTACVSAKQAPDLKAVLDVRRVNAGIPDLNSSDFVLLEGSEKQSGEKKLEKFRDSELGLALIVALDASGSMKGRPLEAIQRGLTNLVHRKRAEDKVAVLSFADDNRWEAKWDTSEDDLKSSFKNLHARGEWTRLYDALDFSIDEFSRAADKDSSFPLRRCILVISDGHDEGSRIPLPELLSKIKQARVRFDAVGMANTSQWSGSLRQISQVGYGEFRPSRTPEDLEASLGAGIDSLLDMPVLDFKTTNLSADGKTHKLTVEYTPAATQDVFDVTLPEPLYFKPIFWNWAGTGLVVCGVLAWAVLRRRNSPGPVAAAPVSIPNVATSAAPVVRSARPPAVPAARAATVAEPGGCSSSPTRDAVPVIQYGQAGGGAGAAAVTVAAVAKRAPTALVPEAQRPAGKLALSAIGGPYAGRRFEVDAPEFWIGSASNNHLCLSADAGVSGNHACVRVDTPFFRLYDNGSLNNTWVNGRPIGQEVTVVRPRDHVKIGETEFVLEDAV